MTDELFFVGIPDHIDVRRELLTSSKNLLDGLKRYERYKNIKEEKLSYVVELKRVFDELLILNKKLRGKMPKTVGTPRMPSELPAPRKGKKVHTKVSKSKLGVLEEELAKIEDRLGSLE